MCGYCTEHHISPLEYIGGIRLTKADEQILASEGSVRCREGLLGFWRRHIPHLGRFHTLTRLPGGVEGCQILGTAGSRAGLCSWCRRQCTLLCLLGHVTEEA